MAKIDHISYGGTSYEIAPAAGDLRDIVAPEFLDQNTYTTGQYVLKNGVLYKFTADHAGAWSDADVESVTVTGELENVDIDPAAIEEAVSDWLDEHPEATTTVPDNSLTETKFTAATREKVANDYVTPEMFGAAGDGTTDDTTAIQDALDSGKNVHFGNKTYATTGVTIDHYIICEFDNTTIIATTLYQDYVINITAMVEFTGRLTVDGKSKAYNGIKVNNAYRSQFDSLKVQYCLAWGLRCTNSGGMHFNCAEFVTCGTSIKVNVSYNSNYILNNDDSTLSARDKECLASAYAKEMFYIDDTGEGSIVTMARKILSYDSENKQFSLSGYAANKMPSTYIDKTGYICYGGCVLIGSGCNSQITFEFVDTRLSSTGITFITTYGHVINAFYSQGDRIPVAVMDYSLGNLYGSITAEGSKSGYVFLVFLYDYSVIVARSTGYDHLFNTAEFSSIVNETKQSVLPILVKNNLRKQVPEVYQLPQAYSIDESSPNTIIAKHNGVTTFNIDLYDKKTNGYTSVSTFGIKTIMVMPDYQPSNNITIKLSQGLIDAGFTINGGADGKITFARPSKWFEIKIMLVYTKIFNVTVSTLAAPENITT